MVSLKSFIRALLKPSTRAKRPTAGARSAGTTVASTAEAGGRARELG